MQVKGEAAQEDCIAANMVMRRTGAKTSSLSLMHANLLDCRKFLAMRFGNLGNLLVTMARQS